MGGVACQLAAVRSVRSVGARAGLPRHHHRQQHGLHRHHQVLQRFVLSPSPSTRMFSVTGVRVTDYKIFFVRFRNGGASQRETGTSHVARSRLQASRSH